MADVISLEIETNLCEFPYEKRFPSSLKLIDFKKKLELVVGAEAANISLKLVDPDGRLVKTLIGDESTLQELGVRSGMRVCAVDISGMNEEINDDSMLEKYEMSEDAYDERQDSVRTWKKRLLAEKPAVAEQHRDDPNEDTTKSIKVGDRCEVLVKGQMARRGCVAFLGTTQFKPGIWVGVKYDEPLGKNDGSVEGVRYFSCDPKYGGFVRPVDVKCGDFPEEEIDEM